MNDQEAIIYAAGLFDGEGCIYIDPSRLNRRSPGLRVQISGNYVPMFEWLVEHFGGSYRPGSRPKRVGEMDRYGPVRHNQKQGYNWITTGASALSFLELVLPYLMEKREQAVAAVHPSYLWGERVPAVSRELLEHRMSLHSELKWLKLPVDEREYRHS